MESTKLVKSVEFINLYIELTKIVGKNELSTDNIMSVVVKLMKVIETFKNIKGSKKRDVIIDVLGRFVENNCNSFDRSELTPLINLTLPSIIDTFVSIDKKYIKIKVNKFLKKFSSCFK
jgi:hypothetical protein